MVGCLAVCTEKWPKVVGRAFFSLVTWHLWPF